MSKDHSKKAKNAAAGLDTQERELFLNAFYQGEIPADEERPLPTHDGAAKRAKITAYEMEEDERELFLSAFTQGVSSPHAREYDGHQAEPAQARLRKKGRVDCSIDLHGMYAKDAVTALLRFIREEKARGAKTMLVIHGKGSGVLKNAVWSIIKTHPDIHDFQQASWRHGGAGAIIIRVGSRKWHK